MGFTAAGIAIDTVTSDQQAPLGFELTKEVQGGGLQVWLYIQMTGGPAALGEVVRRDINIPFVGQQGAATTTKLGALGVAQHSIPQDWYGFVLKKGLGTVNASGVVAAGNDLTPAAAGEVVAFAAGAEHRVVASALSGTAGGPILAMVSCNA